MVIKKKKLYKGEQVGHILYDSMATKSLYCKWGVLQSEMCKTQVNLTLTLIIQGFFLEWSRYSLVQGQDKEKDEEAL